MSNDFGFVMTLLCIDLPAVKANNFQELNLVIALAGFTRLGLN